MKKNIIIHILQITLISVITISPAFCQKVRIQKGNQNIKEKKPKEIPWTEPMDSLKKAEEAYNARMAVQSAATQKNTSVASTLKLASTLSTYDFYVSKKGSDSNTGSESSPFATIQKAINSASTGMAIKVLPGTYYETLNFNGKSLQLYGSPSYPEITVIDANGTGRAITMVNAETTNTLVTGFVLTGGNAANATVTPGHGGAIYLYNEARPRLENLIIRGNTAGAGGAISARHNGDPTLKNCLIYGNTAATGAALYIYNYSEVSMTNVTIGNNNSTAAENGNIFLQRIARVEMNNCIVWGESLQYEITFSSATNYNGNSVATVNYTDLRGGQAGKVNPGTSNKYTLTVNWGTGSINSNPLFVKPSVGDFVLQAPSPCIDAGDPSSDYYDVDFPPGQGTSRNDMGVTGGGLAWELRVHDPLMKGCIAYYPFNNNADDISGFERNGDLGYTKLGKDRFNLPNSSLYFHAGGYVVVPSMEIADNEPFSISFWINPENEFTEDGTSISERFVLGYMAGDYNIRVTDDNCINAYFNDYPYTTSLDGMIPYYEWTHVVYIYDETGHEKWYINGKPEGVSYYAHNIPGLQETMGIGGQRSNLDFYGFIDDVRFYNRGLSTEEVEYLYQTESIYKESYEKININLNHKITPSGNKNYIQKVKPRDPLSNLTDNSIFEANEEVTYFDGLSRIEQTVSVGAGPTGEDIIQPVRYDSYGRIPKKYLPYSVETSSDGSTGLPGQYRDNYFYEQQGFYAPSLNPGADYATDLYAYAETDFEDSPLNRVLEKGSVGEDWQIIRNISSNESTRNGHTTRFDYTTNVSGEVREWKLVDGEFISDYCYEPGELYVTITYNENYQSGDGVLNTMEEYKDKNGKLILKRTYVEGAGSNLKLNTYYVYDDFEQLIGVIPPKAYQNKETVGNNRESVSASVISELCYTYMYDKKGRTVEKKLPGAKPVYMVYNKRGQLIMAQTGNQRLENKWTFTKYDAFSRPIITGELTYTLAWDREKVQEDVNLKTTCYHEEFDIDGPQGYTCRAYPPDNIIVDPIPTDPLPLSAPGKNVVINAVGKYVNVLYLNITYYDNYSIIAPLSGYGYVKPDKTVLGLTGNAFDNFEENFNKNATGLVAVTKTMNLKTCRYLLTVNYYDKKKNLIQVVGDNYLGTKERFSSQYNFAKEVEATITGHNDGQVVIGERFEYDHTGRLLEHWHQIAGNDEVLLAANKYNTVGKLKEKYLHVQNSDNGLEALQKTDYKYNIRGWLTNINDPFRLNGDLFGMSLYYNDGTSLDNSGSNLDTKMQYNGNIATAVWSDAYYKKTKGYGYRYNALNMLSQADYETNNGSVWTNSSVFDVNDITYDLNGNITQLSRNDNTGNSMDVLGYTYSGNNTGNQLIQVDDNATNKAKGFVDGNTDGTDDYDYDANGNMSKDLNKSITNITYNFLNLPEEITYSDGKTSGYVYTATGKKIGFVDRDGHVTKYIGNFVYVDDELTYIMTSEGRIKCGTTPWVYEYHLKDHLGNTRVAFDALPTGASVVQVADYFPFGMRMFPEQSLNNDNKYLYNGKELQDEWGTYDYGFRQYDPSLGRWHVPDPLADMYSALSPYAYVSNNPIRYIDPLGLDMEEFDGQPRQTGINEIMAKVKQGMANFLYGSGNWAWTSKNGKQKIVGLPGQGTQNSQGSSSSSMLSGPNVVNLSGNALGNFTGGPGNDEPTDNGNGWHPPMALPDGGAAANSGGDAAIEGKKEYHGNAPTWYEPIDFFTGIAPYYDMLAYACKVPGGSVPYLGKTSFALQMIKSGHQLYRKFKLNDQSIGTSQVGFELYYSTVGTFGGSYGLAYGYTLYGFDKLIGFNKAVNTVTNRMEFYNMYIPAGNLGTYFKR